MSRLGWKLLEILLMGAFIYVREEVNPAEAAQPYSYAIEAEQLVA